MSTAKTIIFLGDGMADEGVPELNGKTPLQHAHTPAMDSVARDGASGTLLTLPDGFPTSSEVANMSVLGCDLNTEYCGRGPLEAIGRGIPLAPDDKAFRINLTTQADGVLTDYSGGHLDPATGKQLIEVLNAHFGTDLVRIHPGVSYRNILVLSGPGFSHEVVADKPDDNHGQRIVDHLPRAAEPAAEPTAAFLRRLMLEAPSILEACATNRAQAAEGKPMANGVWPWSGGKAGHIRRLQDKYGISSAVISAVDVIIGLGHCLGMDVLSVPGATGYTDTNYEGKADAAIRAIETHDLVYVHIEATDETSHEQDLPGKLKAIENFDRRVVGRVLEAVGPDVNVAVLPDHPVPLVTGKHTRTPVPVAARIKGRAPDAVQRFDEDSAQDGELGPMRDGDLMALLFGPARG